MKKLFLIFGIGLTLSSCTISGSYYLINNSDQLIKIVLNLNYWNPELNDQSFIKKGVLPTNKLKYKSYKKLIISEVKLDYVNRSIEFELPENHVAFIGKGINTRISQINQIQITDSDGIKKIDPNDNKTTQIELGGFGNYVGIINFTKDSKK